MQPCKTAPHIRLFDCVLKSSSAAALATFATMTGGLTGMPASASAASQMWEPVKLPFEDTLYDIDFNRYVLQSQR